MPLILRANYPDTYTNGSLFDEAFLIGYVGPPGQEQPEVYPSYMRVFDPSMTPAKSTVRSTSLAVSGAPSAVSEGGEIVADTPTEGYSKTHTHSKFAKAIKITDEALSDDQLGLIAENIRQYGEAFRDWREDKCAGIFRDAFAGSTYTGGDGLALCSTAHTFPGSITTPTGGSTTSNRGSQALSVASLDIGLAAMEETITMAGKLKRVRPNVLMVPPKLFPLASRLLGSPQLPQSSLNDVNPTNSLGLSIVANPWLSAAAGGSDVAWFLLATGTHQVSYWQRTDLIAEIVREGTTQSTQYQTTHRAAFGFNDWIGVYGSTGTGA